MKRCCFFLVGLLSAFLVSCAPVLTKEVMDAATREASLAEIKADPDLYREKLFVFGGIIVETRGTAEGSLIETLYVGVDSLGYLIGPTDGRLLALYPKEMGFLDPMIFRRGREVTLAAEFVGMRAGKIDDLDYLYPFFEIKEIFLWEETRYYYAYPYYFGYPYFWWDYSYPFWWDRPFFRHHRPVPHLRPFRP